MTDLAERYGAPSTGRRKAVVAVVVVLVCAALSWLAWVMLSHGRPLVQSDLVGFERVDEHRVEATFTVVRRDADVAASCLVRALAADHSVVGELDVAVGPGGATRQNIERTLRTEREATSVELVGCRTDGQTRRR